MLGVEVEIREGCRHQPSYGRIPGKQMRQSLHPTSQATGPRREQTALEPDLLIDLEAENAVLRAALARSEGAGARRELITQELKHRIGNMLAVVQAVARQTFKEADSSSLEDFTARLMRSARRKNC